MNNQMRDTLMRTCLDVTPEMLQTEYLPIYEKIRKSYARVVLLAMKIQILVCFIHYYYGIGPRIAVLVAQVYSRLFSTFAWGLLDGFTSNLYGVPRRM